MTAHPYALGAKLACSAPEADAHLSSGFSFREPWGRWTEGARASLAIGHGLEAGLLLVELWAARAFCADGERCDLVILAGWGEPRLFSLGPDGGRMAFVVSAEETRRSGLLEVDLRIVRAKRSGEAPADVRALGVGLEAYRITLLP